jgi:hypothetical protein
VVIDYPAAKIRQRTWQPSILCREWSKNANGPRRGEVRGPIEIVERFSINLMTICIAQIRRCHAPEQ